MRTHRFNRRTAAAMLRADSPYADNARTRGAMRRGAFVGGMNGRTRSAYWRRLRRRQEVRRG